MTAGDSRRFTSSLQQLLTPSELKDLPNQHEAGLSQGVPPPFHLLRVVRHIAVIIVVLLQTTWSLRRSRRKQRRRCCCGAACTSV